MPNTIVLKGDLYRNSEEAYADGAITPGMLVENTTTATTQPGERPRVQAHSTAGGYAEKMFAIENSYRGGRSTTTLDIEGGLIDDAYAADDLVFIHYAQPGDEIYALLPANAAAVIKTDFLTSSGDGTVKKATSTDQRLFKPLEAVDNSANSSTARIRIRVL